ncbi:site-2 protease family protein [Nocardiopsis alba]|uniref:site-2 protease family protein n=1 Tax=Nocardiopsis alba TaxID=53437 RepID=UPI0033F2413B
MTNGSDPSAPRPDPRSRKPGLLIGRPFGVPVYVTSSWWIVAVLITLVYGGIVQTRLALGPSAYLLAFVFAVLLYASVLVHELAHSVVARWYGLPVRRIVLYVLGGVSEIDREAPTPGREFWIAFSGPLLSLVLAAGAYGLARLADPFTVTGELLFQLWIANLLVGVFNLLPGLPLDGGRLLRAGVWKLTGRPHTAGVVAAWGGRILALGVAALPFLLAWSAGTTPGPWAVAWGLFLAGFMWLGAGQAADRRLTEVRKTHPDAGGLVIASDHENARAYSRILRQITGKGATVVLSDDPTASKKISRFAAGDDRWMVAVRMVSEGVDVPRLMVGVYATSTSTPLFFAQAIGRFVRVRKRGEVASVFLPSVPTLLEYAGEMERERDHVLDKTPSDDEYPEEDLLREANKKKDSPDAGEELPFETMESAAEFDRALYDGLEYGGGAAGSSEEEDFLGLPGLLEPDQVSQLLRKRKADIRASELKAKARRESEPEEESGPTHEVLAELRRELSGLVGAWHHRTGKPHGVIHNELRRACGGPPVAQASPPQIRERIAKLRAWAVGQK